MSGVALLFNGKHKKSGGCSDMDKIKIAVVGIGNCPSSLIRVFSIIRIKGPGCNWFDALGYWWIPIIDEVVAAFDVDKKGGKDVNEAIFIN